MRVRLPPKVGLLLRMLLLGRVPSRMVVGGSKKVGSSGDLPKADDGTTGDEETGGDNATGESDGGEVEVG